MCSSDLFPSHDKLIPIYVDEVLPGDTFSLSCTAFGRMATPIFPIMDNLHMDAFFFFVPYRLIWDNWKQFMGEQKKPGDSTDFLVPQVSTPVGGWSIGSLGDYFGLPTVGQVDVFYPLCSLGKVFLVASTCSASVCHFYTPCIVTGKQIGRAHV